MNKPASQLTKNHTAAKCPVASETQEKHVALVLPTEEGQRQDKEKTEVTSKSLAGPSELLLVMPIRQGFVDCLDTRTYKSRLKSTAKVFTDLRAASRESRLMQPFSDIVDRIRTIYSVHIAVLEPDKVLLAVSFDQPWEPYIRVVWRSLGPLLDPILSNCEGYAGVHSSDQGFEKFAQWIRAHQINTDTYYVPGNRTFDDILYLDQLERIYREGGPGAELQAAAHTVRGPEEEAAARRPQPADLDFVGFVKLGVKAITAFHTLTNLYPKQSDDHAYLYSAAREALREFPNSDSWPEQLATIRTLFKTELDWFEQAPMKPLPSRCPAAGKAQRPSPAADEIQGGIRQPYDANVGCLVLLQVLQAPAAREFLLQFKDSITADEGKTEHGIYYNIAFTAEGLRQLGAPQSELQQFPKEFRDGMAARAGLIGDVRSNHPDHWQLPQRNWPSLPGASPSVQHASLDTVDIVIQLRKQVGNAEAYHEISEKHPLFPAIEKLDRDAKAKGGLRILSVQPMYGRGGDREHFGFVDGISQPRVSPGESPISGRHDIAAGEIFLGHANDRGDPAPKERSALRDNGTFLVIRKLEQNVALLDEFVEKKAAEEKWSKELVLAKMMGRSRDGVPQTTEPSKPGDNDFDYKNDSDGSACPFFAHIRRTNPRDGKQPRIMRRGMCYGPEYSKGETEHRERGLIFQAYNASIAEQFEVMQRWISGGNSSGSYSQQSDPFLGVPEAGKSRILTTVNNYKVVRFDLGQHQFVTLRWGLYLFVPSLNGLQNITQFGGNHVDDVELGQATIDALEKLACERGDDEASNAWKQLLEEKDSLDDEQHHPVWRAIRENHNGVLRTPYGVLVADREKIETLLSTPDTYSVAMYNERLDRCIGTNYLGLDPPEHDTAAKRPNAVINGVEKKDAFAAAFEKTSEILNGLANIPGTLDIPLLKYADLALAGIAQHWFGIPDPDGDFVQAGGQPAPGEESAHCPYHFTSPSRYVFQPQPTLDVECIAQKEGRLLQSKIRAFVDEASKSPGKLGPLAKKLSASIKDPDHASKFASVLLGALIGFMPTVQGNFITTMREWARTRELWRLLDDYHDRRQQQDDVYAVAVDCVEPRLVSTMAKRPVPALLHRWVTKNHELEGTPLKVGDQVVLGLVSAAVQGVDREYRDHQDIPEVFGGEYGAATHACPARKMAIGTLLGMICALLEQEGTYRPTSSPLLLTLELARTERE